MKLSTKGRYGIRAMYELALAYGEGTLSVKEIARKQGISEAYLEQLIAPLRKEKLVTSVRGAQGGYTLSAPPEQISVGAILRALEGPLAPAACVLEEDSCQNADGCAMHRLWSRIHVGVNELLDSITLQDMLTDSTPCHCGQQ